MLCPFDKTHCSIENFIVMTSDISLGSKNDSCGRGSVGCSESLCSYRLIIACLRNDNLGKGTHFISFLPVSSSLGSKTHDGKQEVLTMLEK